VSYQTYIPEEWREMRERERAATAKAEAAARRLKRQRTAQWKKALYTTGKIIGWITIGLAALLVLMAGLLMASGKRRR
jgi:ElaB/YqjD/DUF883 family membrane-anchored ribosome-binding protein